MPPENIAYLSTLLTSFFAACEKLPGDTFINPGNRRFNIALFEACFTAIAAPAAETRSLVSGTLDAGWVNEVSKDPDFQTSSRSGSTKAENVDGRIARALSLLPGRSGATS